MKVYSTTNILRNIKDKKLIPLASVEIIYQIWSIFFTDECDMRSNYVKCDTCKQAVNENAFDNHRQDKKCTSITLLFWHDMIIEGSSEAGI